MNLTKLLVYLGLIILLLAFPLILNKYYLYILVLVGFFIMLACGLNLIFGYTGQISVCHGVFYAIGAYSSALLVLRLGWSFWLAMPVSVIITAIAAFLVGIPLLRTRGPYFAIGTMALGIIVTMVIHNSDKLTGGVSLPGIPPINPIPLPGLGQITFTSLQSQYYLVFLFIALTVFVINRIVNSRIGRAFIAIREDEELAEVTGINAMRFKILAFTIGSAIAGLAGALYSGFMGAIDPGMASVFTSFTILVMVVVGGAGTILGPIFGTAIIWIIPEILHAAETFRLVIYGLVIILVIIFMPHGVVGRLRSISAKIAQLLP